MKVSEEETSCARTMPTQPCKATVAQLKGHQLQAPPHPQTTQVQQVHEFLAIVNVRRSNVCNFVVGPDFLDHKL